MKNKLYILLIISFFSCKKYQDGPSFSLKSAKSRLCREWKGFVVGSTAAWIDLSFNKDGSGHEEASFFSNPNGNDFTWTFKENKTQVEGKYFGCLSNNTIYITKLTTKELWFTTALNPPYNEYHLEAQ